MKLHLGCGLRHIPGFVHVDLLAAPHVDIVGPVEQLPIDDASVSLIYASHVLEHFGRFEYRAHFLSTECEFVLLIAFARQSLQGVQWIMRDNIMFCSPCRKLLEWLQDALIDVDFAPLHRQRGTL